MATVPGEESGLGILERGTFAGPGKVASSVPGVRMRAPGKVLDLWL